MKKVKLFEQFTANEAFIGPFVFNDTMSDEELKAMYDGALDGYANWQKGFQHPKAKYKQAYQEIEKLLKKRGVSVDESTINEAKGKDLIQVKKLDWVDHTRLIKFVSKEFGKLDITVTRTGGYTIDPSGLSGAEVEILLDYLRSQKYIIEQKIDGSVDSN
jgi:hypothetical protein